MEEETGLRCRLAGELASSRYRVGGRPKLVRYWRMEPVEDLGFAPNDEVDEVRWLRAGDALRLLTYDRDREVLRAALA